MRVCFEDGLASDGRWWLLEWRRNGVKLFGAEGSSARRESTGLRRRLRSDQLEGTANKTPNHTVPICTLSLVLRFRTTWYSCSSINSMQVFDNFLSSFASLLMQPKFMIFQHLLHLSSAAVIDRVWPRQYNSLHAPQLQFEASSRFE